MPRAGKKREDGVQQRLREGIEQFGHRFHDEAKGVEARIKEGIASAVEDGRRPTK